MQVLNDAVEIVGKPRRTSDGYVVVDSAVARSGIQEYYAAELGPLFKDRAPNDVIRLYRPPEVIFSDSSLRSYAHKPLTNDHPRSAVTAETWKEVAIGWTGDEARQEGRYVRVPMLMADADAIADVESGKREWSAGYSVAMDVKSGITPEGEPYDAIVTDQKINHIALVDKGRAGPECRIVDKQGGAPVATEKMIVDGVPIDVTDAAKAVIQKLQTAVADSEKAITELKAAHDVTDAQKDAKIADLEAKVAELSDTSAIEAKIAARAALVSDAKAIHDADYSNMDEAAIRRAVVEAVVGDSVKGKSDEYISARFDVLKDSAAGDNKDALREAIKDSKTVEVTDARAGYIKRMTQNKKDNG